MADKYLILGSSGMLGQAFINELENQAIAAAGIARSNADYNIDVTQEKKLLEAIEEITPTVIVNTVAITDLDYCEKNPAESNICNANVSKFLAPICKAKNIKYVYISTDHFYINDCTLKHSEEKEVNLCNQYAKSKFKGEEFSLDNEDALIVRTNIVGFRGKKEQPTFLEWALNSLEKMDSMILFEDYYTSSIDVRTFSKLLIKLVNKDAKGVFNLASSEVSNKRQFIESLAKKLNLSLVMTKPGLLSTGSGSLKRNNSLGLDVSKAEDFLGETLPCLSEVIESLAEDYH